MPLWGKIDQANNAPKYKILPNSADNGEDLFGTQVVGLDDGEVGSLGSVAHSGWVRVQRGTGPVTELTIADGGSDYANSDTIEVTGGDEDATATLETDGDGVITSITLTSGGSGFANTSVANVEITTSAGTGADITVTLGGRAGRVQTEVLVTQSAMTSNNSTL